MKKTNTGRTGNEKPPQKKRAKKPRKTAEQKKWAKTCEGLDDHPWMPKL